MAAPARWRWSPTRFAAAVTLAGLVASAALTWSVDRNQDFSRQRQFDRLAEGAREVIDARIERVTELLFGLQALFQQGEVTRAGFHDYVEAALIDRLEGLVALTFNRAVAPAEVGAFEAAVAGDASVRSGGYPGFRVVGDAHPGDAVVIDFLEPYEGNEPAHGFDVRSEPVRRAAVDEARDSGDPVATRAIELLQAEVAGRPATGVLIVMPVYDRASATNTGPERRRAFAGVVVAAVRLEELLADALGSRPIVGFEIYDVGPTVGRLRTRVSERDLLFDADDDHAGAEPNSAEGPNRFLDLDVAGRRWRIFAEATGPLPGGPSSTAVVGAALSGVAVSVLAGVAVAVMVSARTRQRRELFQGFLDFTPDAVVATDRTGVITHVNAGVEGIFGYPPSELVGRPVEILLPEALGPRHVEHRRGYMASPRMRPMGEGLALVGRHRDGTEVPVEISLSPLQRAEGVVFAAAIRDVTERRRAERTLRAALDREQEATQKLRDVDALKDEFLDITAHELRTPLTSVLGFAELLLRRGESMDAERVRDLLARIEANATEMREMVNRLLDLSRLRAGRIELHPEALDLREAIEGVANRPRIAGGDRIVVEGGAGVLVLVDPQAFDHVLSNLVSNAIKFSPEMTEVTIAGHREGEEVVLSVTDRGPGINPDDLPQLFERFFQGGTQTTDGRGVGVGLSIVNRYVDLWGGRVWVDTELGKGSTFFFTVPVADDAVPAEGASEDSDG